MLDTLYIDAVEQADALLKPKRVEVLRQLAEPRTCTQIGQVLGDTPQAVYYHVKRLQAHGLVALVEEHRVRGIIEGVYQSVARSFWVAPAVVGRLGEPRTREALLGLGFLLDLTENMQRDLARLADGPPTLPSFGIAAWLGEGFEQGFVLFATLLGLSTLVWSYRRHRVMRAIGLLLPGLAALWFGVLYAPLHHSLVPHAIVMTFGGTLVGLAHLLNLRLNHGHVHDASCAH